MNIDRQTKDIKYYMKFVNSHNLCQLLYYTLYNLSDKLHGENVITIKIIWWCIIAENLKNLENSKYS